MKLRIRLFAICRERTGKDEIELTLATDETSVKDALEALERQEPELSELLPAVRVAVNQDFVTSQHPVCDGDELALIPPVSGGSGVKLAEIRTQAIDAREVEDAVRAPHIGAVSTFIGTVRDHTGAHAVQALAYEAYTEMATKTLHAIGAEVCEKYPRAHVAILHRVGHLPVGETSVAIAVGSPHRAEAFEGCRHIIERLKEDVPIWKKEHRRDGSRWVGMGS